MALPEEYKLAIDRQEVESTRYWSRSNIMLLVQGVMITFYSGIYRQNMLLATLLSVEGLFLSVVWIAMLAKGKQYVSRWDEVIKDMEAKSKRIEFPLCKSYGDAKRSERKRKLFLSAWSTTTLMEIAVASTALFWAVVIALSIVSPDRVTRRSTEEGRPTPSNPVTHQLNISVDLGSPGPSQLSTRDVGVGENVTDARLDDGR